ncbi:mediator complex protein-domain-containing protein [Microdochium trichocladiopsis]|uniref:Mediator of RNA polymerase II transcription subunit 11 n=1 Tax=Microdochium trichocladiopsis TaxID=1682393 RepID=A0A9P8Y964_9PEZI|nr:mediator complex protein-domain-containing protein [Microdochium trichocladiopsis]KAH7033080.1 mediator complex protein-domain-containing protein [Microdochium trichocladiopsis]
MNSGMDEEESFVPFTKAERIEQLGQIDKDIVSLLRSVGRAVGSLGKKEPQDGEEDTKMGDASDRARLFQDSMDEFIRTLRVVNTGMKRQIYGLEEANIVTLRKDDSDAQPGATSETRMTPLEPDGDGRIGGLDPGWLNSRSNKVERDMEAELWEQAEMMLRHMMEDHNGKAVTHTNKMTLL